MQLVLSELTWDKAATILGRLAAQQQRLQKQADLSATLGNALTPWWQKAWNHIQQNKALQYGLLGALGTGTAGAAIGALNPQRGRSRTGQALRNFLLGGLLGGGVGGTVGMFGPNPLLGLPKGILGGGVEELTNKAKTDRTALQEEAQTASMSPTERIWHEVSKRVERPGLTTAGVVGVGAGQEALIRGAGRLGNSQLGLRLRGFDSIPITRADVSLSRLHGRYHLDPAVQQQISQAVGSANPINWNSRAQQRILEKAFNQPVNPSWWRRALGQGESAFYYKPPAVAGSRIPGLLGRLPLPLLLGSELQHRFGGGAETGQARAETIQQQLNQMQKDNAAIGIYP